jgi:hypothetical protein
MDRDLRIEQQLDDEWGALAPTIDPEFRKQFIRYLGWLEAACGWQPFHFEQKCSWCKEPIKSYYEMYRCYECDSICHKKCLIAHCDESRRATELRTYYEKQGRELPSNWRDLDPHALLQD